MGNSVILYSTLDKGWRKKLNCRIDELNARYTSGNETYELKCNEEEAGTGRFINIVDDSGQWSPNKHNIELFGSVIIENVDTLFGQKGIVSHDAKLGIGMMWRSRTSGYRGSQQINTVCSDDGTICSNFNKAFSASSLRGSLELVFQLYVIDPGSGDNSLKAGMLLGELDSVNLVLEGIGSTFAVFEKSSPGEPLWEVECDWDDPEVSQFTDSVRVTINNAHPAWIACSEEDTRKELLKEIMASSMQIVLSELETEQFSDSSDYEPGSVCDAMAYLLSRAELDLESNATVAKSIRRYLDKSMK